MSGAPLFRTRDARVKHATRETAATGNGRTRGATRRRCASKDAARRCVPRAIARRAQRQDAAGASGAGGETRARASWSGIEVGALRGLRGHPRIDALLLHLFEE